MLNNLSIKDIKEILEQGNSYLPVPRSEKSYYFSINSREFVTYHRRMIWISLLRWTSAVYNCDNTICLGNHKEYIDAKKD